MRVLWFANDPMAAVREKLGGQHTIGTGHWMSSLLAALVGSRELRIEIATAYPGLVDDEFEKDGVKYFTLGQPRIPGMFFQCRQKDLDACASLVQHRKPDLVHIHGTERFYALLAARELISPPAVISLQGLLTSYASAFFGALSALEFWRSNRMVELVTGRGLFWLYRSAVRGAKREREILAGARAFMGRTDWDRAHVRSTNLNARYYHVGEVLRQPFARHRWDISRCDRETVIFTNPGAPVRGTEVLLQAMLAIRREFPNAKLRLAANLVGKSGYHRFLRQKIAQSGLSQAVELLGYLDANTMAAELSRSHVFAISSYIENSPNSLCEAMQVGLPCVASYVGGIPSLIEQNRTGLLFPAGDAPLLADAIIRIFRNDDLARRLGTAARAEASERHAPERIVLQLMNAYNNVIAHAEDPYYIEAISRA